MVGTNIIRFAAVLCVVSMIAMMAGWQQYSNLTLAIDIGMIIIWIGFEIDKRKKG